MKNKRMGIIFIFLVFIGIYLTVNSQPTPTHHLSDVICPIDSTKLPSFEHKIGTLVGTDSDFMPHYKDGLPPQKIYTCPTCLFSGPRDWFELKLSDSIKDSFIKDKFSKTRFIRDLGREPRIDSYADNYALCYYSSYIISLPQTQRFNLALNTSNAFRNDIKDIDTARESLLDFCGIKILSGNITFNFDFDIIQKAEKNLNNNPSPQDSVKIMYSIAVLFRYHGENQKALFYMKSIENLMNNLIPEQKIDIINKLTDLQKSIEAEQEFQRYALSAALLALRNKEISFLDFPIFSFHIAELHRRLNNPDEAKKFYLIAQKFSMPDNSELMNSINQQARLVDIDINPYNTPKIYQILFLMFAILLYGYVELEAKAIKEFNEWRRKYFFKRSTVIFIIASFLCFQSAQVYLTTITAQVAFLASAIFFIFAIYIIRANLTDEKYFPIIRERRILLTSWEEMFGEIKRRLEEKKFDITNFNYDGTESRCALTTKHSGSFSDQPKVKINYEIEKTEQEILLKGELIPLQPIILPGVEIKNVRRLFRYVFGEGKEMPKISANPVMIYFLIPLILLFIAVRIGIIIKSDLMLYLPHHFFIIYPTFIFAGLVMTFLQIFFNRKKYTGVGLIFLSILMLAIASYLSLYLIIKVNI